MELRGIYQRFAFPFSNNQYLQITLNYYIQVQFQLYIRFLFISNIKDVFSNQQGFWQWCYPSHAWSSKAKQRPPSVWCLRGIRVVLRWSPKVFSNPAICKLRGSQASSGWGEPGPETVLPWCIRKAGSNRYLVEQLHSWTSSTHYPVAAIEGRVIISSYYFKYVTW